MVKDPKDRKPFIEGIEMIVEDAKAAAKAAIRHSGAESLGENLKETLEGALSARENVVMVRLNKESVGRLDELVESGVVNSRSEAAAFLIGEGIKKRQGLFDQISDKIDEIRKAKDELRHLLEESPAESDEEPTDDSKKQGTER